MRSVECALKSFCIKCALLGIECAVKSVYKMSSVECAVWTKNFVVLNVQCRFIIIEC